MVAGIDDFQILKREIIHQEIIFLRNALYFGNVLKKRMVGIFYQVGKNSSCGGNCQFIFFYTEAFQGFGFEMPCKFLIGVVILESPVFQRKTYFVFQLFGEAGSALVDDFARSKGMGNVQQLLHISLRNKELPRGDIHQCYSVFAFLMVDGHQEVILSRGQNLLIKSNSWGYQLCNTAFYNAFHEFGVFQLVADGHTHARPYQFGQVGIERMMREACQLGTLATVVSLGEDYPEDLGSSHGILPKGLIEISNPEKQHCICILRFYCIILRHQRGFFRAFCHTAFLFLLFLLQKY